MQGVDDTMTRILRATMKGVRIYGLEGVRLKKIAELAGLTAGAIYRYFDSRDDLLRDCFTVVDRQVAALYDQMDLDTEKMKADPVQAVWELWSPYFQFWTARPDETVFYYRYRDSAFFPAYDRMREVSYFGTFVQIVMAFQQNFPHLAMLNADVLWLHLLNTTVMYAKYVVEGVLPNTEETQRTVFRLLLTGLSGFLQAPAEGDFPASGPC